MDEEQFGPVLPLLKFDDYEDVIARANATDYGLGGSVWGNDEDKALEIAQRVASGTVWVNDYGPYTPAAEWGGFGRSGHGRELGPSGLHEYQQLKHVWTHTGAPPAGWFRSSLDDRNKP